MSTTLHEEIIEVQTDDGTMAVVRKRPAGDGSHPLVAFFMDAPGIRDALHGGARRIAAEGYDVLLLDLYHRNGRMIGYGPSEMASNPEARPHVTELMSALTDDGIQSDLDAALRAVGREDDGPMGCIGFCLGARCVFNAMLRLPDRFVAGAMFHPSFLVVDDEDDSPHLRAAELSGALYLGIGEADEVMSVALTQPFLDVVSRFDDRVRIDIHPGADHGYTWPDSPNYDESAAETSWAAAFELFADHLGA